jgi:hypothetical protein
MDDLGKFVLLAWLLGFATIGTWVVWRPALAPKVLGVSLVLLGLAPSLTVLWTLAVS